MHDIEPVDEKVLEKHYWEYCRGGGAPNVICCVLADIFSNTNDEHLKMQCRRATAMAKAMSMKLQYYKKRLS